eukprot:CAMPEP_0206227562 /NCGR_PEP_ID=MMETSP0047_2-20121206/8692_1 /ASSEMBLY_ACC=CAM_ASM_000192 /TAXON_ID=195065 /ORGANISM="Chroomonas mesostigmatica_cf, Strain CCMP1168" /LENGTH=61 /DNA_ID=CAMNT_0053650727 /DNA_START=312 /DNA_END=493 /DNA_ORIENTATION=-
MRSGPQAALPPAEDHFLSASWHRNLGLPGVLACCREEGGNARDAYMAVLQNAASEVEGGQG